jgi:hypothetical protein
MKPGEIKIGMRVRIIGGAYMAGCVGIVIRVTSKSAGVTIDYNGGSYDIALKYLERE